MMHETCWFRQLHSCTCLLNRPCNRKCKKWVGATEKYRRRVGKRRSYRTTLSHDTTSWVAFRTETIQFQTFSSSFCCSETTTTTTTIMTTSTDDNHVNVHNKHCQNNVLFAPEIPRGPCWFPVIPGCCCCRRSCSGSCSCSCSCSCFLLVARMVISSAPLADTSTRRQAVRVLDPFK